MNYRMNSDIAAGEIKGFLDLNVIGGRYSSLLVEQLVAMREHRSGNTFAIIDEISVLEGAPNARPTNTKPAKPFSGPVLSGLLHKHYFDAAFIPQNIENQWRSSDLDERCRVALTDPSVPDEKKAGYLAHDMIINSYVIRSQSNELTGEWIVFAQLEEVNYYLTLGKHTEDDKDILARALSCCNEFPQLAACTWFIRNTNIP
jgi:hypothetical protein